jgi:hypothetical protein
MHGIHPAPPIMTMPPGMPTPVEEAIEASFALYWVDVGAAASKLRASVERLMDHYKITKTRLRPTGGKNKRVPLELASRIDKFISAMQPDISAKTLHALRIVGNLGTHDTVTSYVLLQAFEVYEDTLRVLIGKHSKNIERLVKRIHARKGRP